MHQVRFSAIEIVADAAQPADELLALDEALAAFQSEDPEKAELVRLRYFAGLTEEEAARTMNISRATASRWWAYSKAWFAENELNELQRTRGISIKNGEADETPAIHISSVSWTNVFPKTPFGSKRRQIVRNVESSGYCC